MSGVFSVSVLTGGKFETKTLWVTAKNSAEFTRLFGGTKVVSSEIFEGMKTWLEDRS